MASSITVIGVVIAILVFSAPLCYFAYLGMHEQRDLLVPTSDTSGEEDLGTALDQPD